MRVRRRLRVVVVALAVVGRQRCAVVVGVVDVAAAATVVGRGTVVGYGRDPSLFFLPWLQLLLTNGAPTAALPLRAYSLPMNALLFTRDSGRFASFHAVRNFCSNEEKSRSNFSKKKFMELLFVTDKAWKIV